MFYYSGKVLVLQWQFPWKIAIPTRSFGEIYKEDILNVFAVLFCVLPKDQGGSLNYGRAYSRFEFHRTEKTVASTLGWSNWYILLGHSCWSVHPALKLYFFLVGTSTLRFHSHTYFSLLFLYKLASSMFLLVVRLLFPVWYFFCPHSRACWHRTRVISIKSLEHVIRVPPLQHPMLLHPDPHVPPLS